MDSQLLAEALGKDKQFEICGACCSSGNILSIASRERPDITLLSSELEDGKLKGFEVARSLRSSRMDTRVVMLVDSSERANVVEAFRCGARGLFCRTESLSSLAKCIQRVHAGQVWATSSELLLLLEALAETPAPKSAVASGSEKLSKRERDVVQGVAQGLTNREIAHQLGLTEHTVKNYLFRIFDKLGVSTRVELVLHALAVATPASREYGTLEFAQRARSVSPKPVVPPLTVPDMKGRMRSRKS
jgi:two-component system nitrate/nitrite response regulator NarL